MAKKVAQAPFQQLISPIPFIRRQCRLSFMQMPTGDKFRPLGGREFKSSLLPAIVRWNMQLSSGSRRPKAAADTQPERVIKGVLMHCTRAAVGLYSMCVCMYAHRGDVWRAALLMQLIAQNVNGLPRRALKPCQNYQPDRHSAEGVIFYRHSRCRNSQI